MEDTARKRALLLYQAGPEVHEIFKTLPDTGDEKNYEAAVNALTAYFEPEKNRIYQTYMFRQASQQDNETIDEFHTHLRRLAKQCEFVDVEFEIKMQIVCNGTSSRLRKKALKESNYSLKDMLIDGRKSETCSAQASGMEEKFKDVQLNQVERLLNLSAITVDLLTLIWLVLVRPQIQLVTRVANLVISLECVERKNRIVFPSHK